MRTIAESLTELQAVKEKLAVVAKTMAHTDDTMLGQIETVANLTNAVVEKIYKPYPEFPIDLKTWVGPEEIGMIVRDMSNGTLAYQVQNTNLGVNATFVSELYDDTGTLINTQSINTTDLATFYWTLPTNKQGKYYAIKIYSWSANPIKRFRDSLPTGYSASDGTRFNDIIYWYDNITTWLYLDYMFSYNGTLTPYLIGAKLGDTTRVITFTGAFSGCQSLVWVENISTNSATAIPNMYNSCVNLIELPEIMNTSTATSMDSVFVGCRKLQKLPLGIDTSNATNVSSLFANCSMLKRVPEVLNISKATTTFRMFGGCSSLQNVPYVLDTSKSTNVSQMFADCNELKNLPYELDVASSTSIYFLTGSAAYQLRNFPVIKNTNKINNSLNYIGAYMFSLPPDTIIDWRGLDWSSMTNLLIEAGFFVSCRGLLYLDFRTAPASIQKLAIPNISGLKELRVPNNGAFTGTAPQINISNSGLDRNALITLFNDLPVLSGKSITITGTAGRADLTADDIAIATNKGWTVTL